MDNENAVVESAEDIAAEQAAQQLPKREDVQAKVLTDFGFDAEADKDKIEKMTNERMENAERLHKTIGQKIKHRTAAEELRKKVPLAKPAEQERKDGEDTLSQTDMYVLTSNAVHPDDVPEVQKAAKILGKSIAETLLDPTFAPVLASRVEKRKSANAVNTETKRPGAGGVSDQQLLDDAAKGIIPKAGTPEARQLFLARRQPRSGQQR